jgi:hypothetical protein
MNTNTTNGEDNTGGNDGSHKMKSCCGEKVTHDHAVKQQNTGSCCCGDTSAEKVSAENSKHTFQRSCCQ